MYSIVLMAAMSGGPDAAAADGSPVIAPAAPMVVGCTGCTGYYSAGCCGGYSTGCCGGYSYGCCGGYATSCCGGGLFHKHSCHGCCGGGFLGHKHSCHGCCGGYSYGCCGGYSCFGSCTGCYGAGWGYAAYSSGCCGGSAGCWGASYAYPVYGAAPVYGAMPVTPTTTPPVVVPPESKPTTKSSDDMKKSEASLKFVLPADAVLYVDGRKTDGAGAERAFFTPPLEAGQKFFYDVRAEMVVDGKTVTEEKRVVVESGAELTESFSKLLAAAEAKKTTVAGK